MPVLAGLLVWMGLSAPQAALLAAAALAVGAVTVATDLLHLLQVGTLLQRIYALANLRTLFGQIAEAQAAAQVFLDADYTAPEVEKLVFDAVENRKAEIIADAPAMPMDTVADVDAYYTAQLAAYRAGLIEYGYMIGSLVTARQRAYELGGGIERYTTPEANTYQYPTETLPYFSNVESLTIWYSGWSAKYQASQITYDTYLKLYNYYSAEYDRLVAPAAEAPDTAGAIDRVAAAITALGAAETEYAQMAGRAQTATTLHAADSLAKAIAAANTELIAAVSALTAALPTDQIPRLRDALAEGLGVQTKSIDNVAAQLTAALAGLSATQAAATTQAGTQVATGSQAAAETQAKAISDSGIATAAAITALAGLGVTAFAKIAKTWGHDVASGQRTCWASTAADLFGQIAGAAVPLSLAVAADKFSPIREAMNQLMQRVFDEIMNAPELQSPVTPDRAPAVAAALFRKAFELGQAAHLLAVLAEVVTPLKMLGVGQVAAFLADMAGFAKIGGAAMGVIESQALGRPFGYYMNQKTLTNRPNAGQLGALASDQAITREEYISEMAYQGYVRTWAEELYDTAFRALAPRQLQMMAEAGTGDDDYFKRELTHSGLRPETITRVLEMFRLAALGELKPTGQAVAIKRYTEGITSEIELRQELDSLGFRAIKLEAAVRLARLSRDTDLLLERITIAVNSYLADDISEAQLGTQLTSLGLEPERVKVIHDRAVQRYRPVKLPDRLPRLREQYANTHLNNVELGFATPENISPALLALGYTPGEARLAIDNSKEIARQVLLKDQIAILEDKLTDKEITLDQLRMQLLTLGITPEQVNAHVELNRLRIQPTPKAPAPEEIPQLTTAQLLAAYKTEVLSEAVVRAELLERKYQLADIDVLIRLNTAAAEAPTAATVKLATEAEFKAWFAAGLISDQETYAGLIARGRSDLDAKRIIELELIKAEARLKP